MTLADVLNPLNQWVWRQRLRLKVRRVRAIVGKVPGRFPYAEIRPIPYKEFVEALAGKRSLPTTDCSGFYSAMLYSVGAPDPNGRNFDGAGYTGDCLGHLRQIAASSLRFGDAIVYGISPSAPGGSHMVMAIGSGPNPLVISHGRVGLDVMTADQMSQGFPGTDRAFLAAFTPAGHKETQR